MTDSERIAHLEGAVRALARQVAELREELQGRRVDDGAIRSASPAEPLPTPPSPAPPVGWAESAAAAVRATLDPPPPSPRAAPAGRAASPARKSERVDLEGLVGRYGTMALAALTIVMGVGAFLSWAVEHVELGPVARVALGAVLAALIAVLGWWLRVRDAGSARRFGNTLLGLALAVVHVDAWGAGPYLGVVSSSVALAVAAVASAALATLAFASGEQALFAVGLGGALLAPFVTSTGGGSVPALLGYGLVVGVGAYAALGSAAVRGRRWTLARWLAGGGGAVYAVAAIPMPVPATDWPLQIAPPAFALVSAWVAWILSGREHRLVLARTLLVAALFTLGARGVDSAAGALALGPVVWALLVTAFAAAATAYAIHRDTNDETVEDDVVAMLWGALLPLGFLFAALTALPGTIGRAGAAVALAWVALSIGAALLAPALRRQPALVVASAAASVAAVLGLERQPIAGAAALAAVGAVTTLVASRLAARGEPARLLLFPAGLALAAAALWAETLLAERAAYAYTPFLTRPSLAALAAVAGWFVFARLVSRAAWIEDREAERLRPRDAMRSGSIVGALGVIAAFLWGREELSHAFSRDLATFLLIGYYAVTGVTTIFAGRRMGLPGARRAGLALAVYAALKALAQSAGIDDVALRVGSFLLVGAFLLGVAWWYRANESEVAEV